jgi:oligopeptidase B
MDELTYAAITPDAPVAEPPVAPRRESRRTLHGVTLTDEYAWLKDPNWQEVLRKPELLDADIRAYLEAENRYTEAILGPTKALQEALVREMRGRIKEDDSGSARRSYAYLEIPRGRWHELIAACRATWRVQLVSTATLAAPRTISTSAKRAIRPTIA